MTAEPVDLARNPYRPRPINLGLGNPKKRIDIMDQLYCFSVGESNYTYDSRRDTLYRNIMPSDSCIRQDRIILHKQTPKIFSNRIELKNLILQVCMSCNMACKYCFYSDAYDNRKMDNSLMSYDMAKKAIAFAEKHTKSKNLVIGFYGGEPLINFSLIKRIVGYIRKETRLIPKFYITTNLTLFNEEIGEFLQKNNFTIKVSLDGNRVQHDCNRVFRDGSGTFDVVLSKIRLIKSKFPQLLKNLLFNAVVTSSWSQRSADTFFNQYEEFDINGARIPYYLTTLKNGIKNEVYLQSKRTEAVNKFLVRMEKNQLIFKYIVLIYLIEYKLFNIGTPSPYFQRYKLDEHILNVFSAVQEKDEVDDRVWQHTEIVHHSGPCIPGFDRLFITTTGKFYPCEKVSETCEDYIIGDLDNGYNYSNIVKLLNIGWYTCNHCKHCWAIRFCNFCAAMCENEGKITTNTVNDCCNKQIEVIKSQFEFVAMVLERRKEKTVD